MNYTKGEWQIQPVTVRDQWDDGEIKHYYITGTINGKSDRTIADVGEWRDRNNALEDAHLIAAAPNMYEALKLYTKHQEGKRGHYCSECHDAIDKALAKAEDK